MLPVYVGAFAFGGVLIGASLVLGGHDHDVDHDFDADVDHDLDVGHDLDGIDHDVDGADALDALHDAEGAAHLALAGHEEPMLPGEADVAALAEARGRGIRLPFRSVRFWTWSLASFGMTGTLLTLLGLSAAVHLPAALLTGTAIGWSVAWAAAHLRSEVITSAPADRDFQGRTGLVVLSIAPGRVGKVRVHLRGQDVELLARSREETTIPRGSRVLVVSLHGQEALVTPMPPGSG